MRALPRLFAQSLVTVGLIPVAAWASPPSSSEPPPAGRLKPSAQDVPWGTGPAPVAPAPEVEPETPDPAAPTADNPQPQPPIEPPIEPDPVEPVVPAPTGPKPDAGPKVADPGDARPDGDSTHENLLSVKKPLGPKQIETSAAVYGMVVANVVFDTGTVGPTGESPVFAVAGSDIGEGLPTDGQFLITARQSRFGFKGAVQITERVDINGTIELDFFGLHENEGPTGVIQPGVRLRLAKLEVGDARFRFIAGQDWSVITPRLPTSLSHMVVAAHSFSGAIWTRIPQVTFVFRQPVGASDSALGDPAFKLQVSAVRNFSGDGFGGGITRFDKPDPGTLGMLPIAQARASFESKVFTVGLAGQVGRETWQVARLADDGSLTTIDDHVPTWIVSGDLLIASKWVWVGGQGYYGRNINNVLSNQGIRADLWTATDIDPADPRVGQTRDVVDLPGAGGWAEVGAKLGTEKVQLVASGGADVGGKELVADGHKWLNTGVLAALIYAPVAQFDMSLEYQRIMSFYRATAENAPTEQTRGNNNYVAATFRFKF